MHTRPLGPDGPAVTALGFGGMPLSIQGRPDEARGLERIDLCQLPAPDPAIPFLESVGVLAELQRAGKVRWVGLSNVSVEEIQEAMNVVPIMTVQNRLNPFFREAVREGVVKFC